MEQTQKRHGRGRPAAYGRAMLSPMTVRLTAEMHAAIEAIAAERADGADKGQVLRELLAEALAARGGRRKA